MAVNTLVTPQMITQMPMIILKNATRFVPNVDRAFEKDFGNKRMKIGATENLRRPARFIGRDGQAWVPEGLTDTFVPLTINFQHGVDFQFSSAERALSLEEMESRYLKPAAVAIANKVDYNFGRFMALSVANLRGTPGTAATGTAAQQVYVGAQVLLDQMAFPTDDRVVVYNSQMSANMATTNLTLFNPTAEISKAYRQGLQGRFADMDFYKDENTNVYTFGTYTGTPVVNGGGQTGSALNVNGFTSGTFSGNLGDAFTISGVYAVNPQNRQTTGALQQFVLTAAVTDLRARHRVVRPSHPPRVWHSTSLRFRLPLCRWRLPQLWKSPTWSTTKARVSISATSVSMMACGTLRLAGSMSCTALPGPIWRERSGSPSNRDCNRYIKEDTMNKLKFLLILAAAGPILAQTATTSTTLAGAIAGAGASPSASPTRTVCVASSTGISAPGFSSPALTGLMIDAEYMIVNAQAPGSNCWSVTRGYSGTGVAAHANGATVWVGPTGGYTNSPFLNNPPSAGVGGACATATTPIFYNPMIVVGSEGYQNNIGQVWYCPTTGTNANTWVATHMLKGGDNSPYYIGVETGANNAIVGTFPGVPLKAGTCVDVQLAHTLQAGANTFALNGTSKSIVSHFNTANNIATVYAATGQWAGCYNGTAWVDLSE